MHKLGLVKSILIIGQTYIGNDSNESQSEVERLTRDADEAVEEATEDRLKQRTVDYEQLSFLDKNIVYGKYRVSLHLEFSIDF